MNIYLVGFMGSGKTAVGKALAKKRKMHFVDLDELIESEEKRSIAEIFAQDGESYFRKLERQFLSEVSYKENCVVSCGGGIVIDLANISIMKATGIIICLKASPEVILERTRRYSHRPLLNVPNPKEKIASLLKERDRYYNQSDKIIDTSGISIREVVDKLIDYVERWGAHLI